MEYQKCLEYSEGSHISCIPLAASDFHALIDGQILLASGASANTIESSNVSCFRMSCLFWWAFHVFVAQLSSVEIDPELHKSGALKISNSVSIAPSDRWQKSSIILQVVSVVASV